ncbi:MAG: alpha/beta fold hydrolase [Patescibacteria group bacterium]
MTEQRRASPERPNLQNAIKETYNLGGIHTVVYKPNVPKEQIPENGFRTVMIAPGIWCTSEHYMVSDLADFLLGQGLAVVSFDHRGIMGGKTLSKPHEYHLAHMIEDIETVKRRLKEVSQIDAGRSVGLGISMGGVAMTYAEKKQTISRQSPLFESLVLLSPFVDIQLTARYFSQLVKEDHTGLYLETRDGGKKYVSMDVFKKGAKKYKGIDRELLRHLRTPVGLIFGQEDPQFGTTQGVQSLPSDHLSLDQYWQSLNEQRDKFEFDETGVARKIITINQPRKFMQIGQAFLIKGGNHNLNNSPEIIAERNRIILDRLHPATPPF